MGQRVFQPIVNQQVTNVLNALERQVQDAKAAGAAAPALAEASAADETSGAPEGIHAAAPEPHPAEPEPEGPTHSAQD